MKPKHRARVSGAARTETRVLGARVDSVTFDLVESAARVRGCNRSVIIAAGAVREATRIIEVATKTIQRNRARRRRQTKSGGEKT
jgi:uncharacterized protein (DUF1778 family)